MFGFIAKQITAAVSETVDIISSSAEYVIDDITSIPDAISEGWDNGWSSEKTLEEKKEAEKAAKQAQDTKAA